MTLVNPLLKVPPCKQEEPSRRASRLPSQRGACESDPPSLRFPLLAGGTELLRGSPREVGGTYGGGGFMNYGLTIGI